MSREHFVVNFARRMNTLILEEGLASTKSKAGVKINKLAEVSGCSLQMARRYALGEALPDVDTTYKIAKWLNVSPGWLLFGTESEVPNNIDCKNLIQIDPDVMEYILSKCIRMKHLADNKAEMVRFIMDMIFDATHIDADKNDIKKIIDISINSATRFNCVKPDSETKTDGMRETNEPL